MTRISLTAIAFALAATAYTVDSDAQTAERVISGSEIAIPDYVTKAVNSPSRPSADKARDTGRKPEKVMAFFGVKPGDNVAELITFSGYYALVLSGIVGETGTVYGHNNAWVMSRAGEQSPLLKKIQETGVSNVIDLVSELEDPRLPKGELDAVFIILIYHDTMGGLKTDRVAMNKAIFDALKPGGIYGVVDHHAAPGVGASEVITKHRVERHLVVEEILNAGFEFTAETDLLERLDDPMDVSVMNPSVRGSTHRFVLKFTKPD